MRPDLDLEHVALPRGHFAIRADQIAVTAPDAGKLKGRVTGIEYRGASVALTLLCAGDQEITAVVPEDRHFAKPLQPGDGVGLNRDDRNLHALAPAARISWPRNRAGGR